MEVRLSQLIGPAFAASHAAVKNGALEIVESGGRGSGKSSYLSIEFLLQLLRHPQCHGAVLRKVGSTIRTSTYAQLKWAADALGLSTYFRFTLNPLEAEYLPTGQKLLFLGMDDPGKLKSLKMPFGFIGIAWFEELDQFTAGEVRSAEQSLLRGGDYSLSLKSFNPPPPTPPIGPTSTRWKPSRENSATTPPTWSCRSTGWASGFSGTRPI